VDVDLAKYMSEWSLDQHVFRAAVYPVFRDDIAICPQVGGTRFVWSHERARCSVLSCMPVSMWCVPAVPGAGVPRSVSCEHITLLCGNTISEIPE
jgi:hypothetical protein